jgi:hypothetical protein
MLQCRQTRINDYLSNAHVLLQKELTSSPSSSDSETARRHTMALIKEVYNAVIRGSDNRTGCSARSIATGLRASYCQPSERKAEISLERAIRGCLLALLSDGFVYQTFDERHFGASVTRSNAIDSDLPTLSAKVPAIVHGLSEEFCQTDSATEIDSSTRCGQHSKKNINYTIKTRECNGKLGICTIGHFTRKALGITQKACVYSNNQHQTAGLNFASRSGAIYSVEFSSTSEYLVYGCANGIVTVSKTSEVEAKMRDDWHGALAVVPPLPKRQIHTKKAIEVAHWTPGNRNEIGIASKGSGDVVLYDLKHCGSLSSQCHVPTTTLTHRQGQGVGSVLDFVSVGAKLIIAGTQSGAVVIWDRRDSKKPRGALKQAFGGVCYVQVHHDYLQTELREQHMLFLVMSQN